MCFNGDMTKRYLLATDDPQQLDELLIDHAISLRQDVEWSPGSETAERRYSAAIEMLEAVLSANEEPAYDLIERLYAEARARS